MKFDKSPPQPSALYFDHDLLARARLRTFPAPIGYMRMYPMGAGFVLAMVYYHLRSIPIS